MAKKDYIVNRSNYTIKKRHKLLSDNTIYERDYMTVGNVGSWRNDTLPYGTSNFKLTRRSAFNSTRKHKFGDWETFDGSTIATLNNVTPLESSESKIHLKPYSKNFLDYAYYGSCVDLVQRTIMNIVSTFPAELYVTDKEYYYTDGDERYLLGGDEFDNPVVISNPFDIDLTTESINEEDAYNPLRYFCISRQSYDLLNDKGEVVTCSPEWKPLLKYKNCFENGERIATIELGDDMIICQYQYYDTIVLITDAKFTGYCLRPKVHIVNDFFNNLNDFEKLLLNKETNPPYTATLENIYEDEFGTHYYDKTFTWPSLYGWNLDVTSVGFNNYTNELVKLAQTYDDNFSDNLWRLLVHDSVKNMDLTYSKPNSDEDLDDYRDGTTKIKQILSSYAYIFDELKRYADNISYINNITYNEEKNIPDYFLSDVLNMAGWEVSNTTSTLLQNENTTSLFASETRTYDANDANAIFLRNLKLNSKDILSRKGTREAIEMVLGLFGYMSDDFMHNLETPQEGDYKIEEFVAVAKNDEIAPIDDLLSTQQYNLLTTGLEMGPNEDSNFLDGLPVRLVEFTNADGETYKYIIPWFTNMEDVNNEMYFQMYGGWGKTHKKYINERLLAPDVKELLSTNDFQIYDETQKYLNVVRNLQELIEVPYGTLHNGDIFYVYSLDDYDTYCPDLDFETSSHYFVIKDREYCIEFSEKGWENIPNVDIEHGNNYGLKVLYLESIIDDTTGNNPHVGYGNYDDGSTYLKYFEQLFKTAIENDQFTDDAYDCESGELLSGIVENGFEVKVMTDNVKTWYFTDHYKRHNNLQEINYYPVESLTGISEYDDITMYDFTESSENQVGSSADTFYSTDLEPYNFEGGALNDEAAGNSIINIKNLKITFKGEITKEPEFREYLYKCVMPYLKQVIPSTTILEIDIEQETVEFTCQEKLPIEGVYDSDENDSLFEDINITLNADDTAKTFDIDALVNWEIEE